MKTLRLKTFLKCERGTQMIEFALLLPFLIMLFASAVEMGRMFYTYTTLQKSTQVGARYLSARVVQSDGTFLSADTAAAQSLVVCGKVDCTNQPVIAKDLTISNVTTPAPYTVSGTKYVTVSMSYAYHPLMFDLGSLTGSSTLSLNFTFTPATTMRYLP